MFIASWVSGAIVITGMLYIIKKSLLICLKIPYTNILIHLRKLSDKKYKINKNTQ